MLPTGQTGEQSHRGKDVPWGPFPPAALASWVNPPHQLVHMACGAVLGRALPSVSLLAPQGSQRATTLCQLHAIAPLLALGKRARAAAAPPAWAPCACGASRGLQDKADFSCASATFVSGPLQFTAARITQIFGRSRPGHMACQL